MKNFGLFSQVTSVNHAVSKRSSSWDRTGGNQDWTVIAPGGRHMLLDEGGAGCVNHMYWTYIQDDMGGSSEAIAVRNNIFRGLVLRAYWNGQSLPAIEAPLGDFFGVCNGRFRSIQSLAFTANPGAGGADSHATWGFNCYLPMPYREGAVLEIENQGPCEARIWYHVDYERYGDASFIPEDAGCLHAWWNRENPTVVDDGARGVNLSGAENYVILDTLGEGTLAGYFMTVVNKAPVWWGEGDDMIFIDGEAFPPSLHGTGTEEIFGGGACPDREYAGPYTGFHCIENRSGFRWFGTNGMYRFFIGDPVRFRESIRVSIEHGHANDLANDYSSVAFWYAKQTADRRPLAPLRERAVTDI